MAPSTGQYTIRPCRKPSPVRRPCYLSVLQILTALFPPRCFPHVINIAVKAGLKMLTKLPSNDQRKDRDRSDDSDYDSDEDLDGDDWDEHNITANSALQDNTAYFSALQKDPVVRCRTLVRVCRASWQRRKDLRQAIALTIAAKQSGSSSQAEPLAPPASDPKPKELLRDVDTRWSALFMMIDRALELYEVCTLPSFD